MAWNIKSKIAQQERDEEIQTPDGQQILVGENEDEVLVYDEGFNNWGQEGKQEGEWAGKAKIVSQSDRIRLLTPDGNQVLVGPDEDLVLITAQAQSSWNLKAKIQA